MVRALPVARMPLEWFFSPSMWTLFGADFLSGLRRNRGTRDVFAILAPLGPHDLRRIHALAALNHRRHEAISRWFAIGFLTVPASAALTLSELSPETLRQVAAAEGPASWYLMLGYAGAVVGLYVMFAWRARQLLTIVEMWLIQQGVGLPAEEPAEPGGIEPPVGA